MIWQFRKPNTGRTVEITVELRDGHDYLSAVADDDYHYGDLTREESLDLAREVLKVIDPPALQPGDNVHVVNGPMCGAYGFVLGTVRETGYVILRCQHGILLQPASFVKGGL